MPNFLYLGLRLEVWNILSLLDQSPGDSLIDRFLSIATYPMRSRWEESGKNSLWQIFRAGDAHSYLQYRLAQRTEQFHDSRAQHFNPDLYGSSRSCSLLQWGFHGDPWELSFDFIFPFYFIFIFTHSLIFLFLLHPVGCNYLILAHLFPNCLIRFGNSFERNTSRRALFGIGTCLACYPHRGE